MAAGEIAYGRFTVVLDENTPEDNALTIVLGGLFPILVYDLIHTSVISVSTVDGVTKAVVLVVAQSIT